MNSFITGIDLPKGMLGATTGQLIKEGTKHSATNVVKKGLEFTTGEVIKTGTIIAVGEVAKQGVKTAVAEATKEGVKTAVTEAAKEGVKLAMNESSKEAVKILAKAGLKGAEFYANELAKQGATLVAGEVARKGAETTVTELAKEGAKLVATGGIQEVFREGTKLTLSELFKEGTKQGATAVVTETTQQTVNLVANTATKALSTATTSTVSNAGVGFLATSFGRAALGGSLALATTVGSMFFSKDKMRALVKGAPSVAISFIPGIGIPFAIALSAGSSLIADKIYTAFTEPSQIPQIARQSTNAQATQIPVQHLEPGRFLPLTEVQVIDDLMLQLAQNLNQIKNEMSQIIPILVAAGGGGGGDPDPWDFARFLKKLKINRVLLKKISTYSEDLVEIKEVVRAFKEGSVGLTIELEGFLRIVKRHLRDLLKPQKKDKREPKIEPKDDKEKREEKLLDTLVKPKVDNRAQKNDLKDDEEKKEEKPLDNLSEEEEKLVRHIVALLEFIETINDELRARIEGRFGLSLEDYQKELQKKLESFIH